MRSAQLHFQLAAKLGVSERVRFCGKVSDIPNFLRSVDLFVFCSHKEAYPVAALEAMACGLPSVVKPESHQCKTSTSPAKRRLVVPPDDCEAFASAIDSIAGLIGHRQSLGNKARKRAEATFSLDEEARRYQDFYADLLHPGATFNQASALFEMKAALRA